MDVLWMSGVADLVEHVNQGVLVVRLEHNVEIGCGVGGRATKALPVIGDGIPGVLHMGVVPSWFQESPEFREGCCDDGGEQKEPEVACHSRCRQPLAVMKTRDLTSVKN